MTKKKSQLKYEQNVKVRKSQIIFQKSIDFSFFLDIIIIVSTQVNRVLNQKAVFQR